LLCHKINIKGSENLIPRIRFSDPLILVLLCLLLARSPAATGNGRTIWDGIYAESQAERGAVIYKEHCETCHAANMRGGPGARGVVGLAFQYLWKDKTLGELFEAMRTKMPPGQPGSLSDQEYIDVLSTILQGNGLPAGDMELVPDHEALDQIKIVWEQSGDGRVKSEE
jgi:hypothetical protein